MHLVPLSQSYHSYSLTKEFSVALCGSQLRLTEDKGMILWEEQMARKERNQGWEAVQTVLLTVICLRLAPEVCEE